jgi:mannose-6-phosphate isomerase-like protein (cupin superfamily)
VEAQPTELEIAPGSVLTVLSRSDEELVLEARYEGGGAPPPSHLHPEQDEHFEILSGRMRAVIGGDAREAGAGETFDVPRGTAHKMWNAGEEPVALRWVTRPAGRTLEWFAEIAAVRAGEPLSDPQTLLERYADTFRLVPEPD